MTLCLQRNQTFRHNKAILELSVLPDFFGKEKLWKDKEK